MNVFLLTHNPVLSGPLPPGWVARTAAGNKIHDDWSTGPRRSGLHMADAGYLLRQGDHRGIVATCEFTGEIRLKDHFRDRDRPKRLRRKAPYAPCDWVRVLAVQDRFPTEELLRRVPAVNRNAIRGSGWMLDPKVGQRLRTLWDAHVAKLPSRS